MSLLVPLLVSLSACNASEPPRPTLRTQTNEQGCVRVRSTGPQNPAAIPVPMKQACVGPYLLELPQNYFYNQMGTDFDGSFALALEYPSLEPFKPGERSNLSVDVAIRTVQIDYSYIGRIGIRQALRNKYQPMEYNRSDPSASLDARIEGAPFVGLTPYFVDMERVRTYLRANGLREDAPGMQDRWHTDWFIARDSGNEVSTIIKCTSRGVTDSGVGLRDGKLVRNEEPTVSECDHTFALIDHNVLLHVNYVRMGLPNWHHIEASARTVFLSSIVHKAPSSIRSNHKK